MLNTILQTNDSPASRPKKQTIRWARVSQDLNHPKVVKRLAEMPQLYRRNYRNAMKGNNLRAAINAQCLECVQWVRNEVTLCNDNACPLYPYRPYQEKEVEK